jgi:hypothetical protein
VAERAKALSSSASIDGACSHGNICSQCQERIAS